ncbi:MAG: hypothetical protein K8R48_08395 [Alphaproteobacteria bacterium]|nr:hypothetical protein [Alphaproteobacteria bacterium]
MDFLTVCKDWFQSGLNWLRVNFFRGVIFLSSLAVFSVKFSELISAKSFLRANVAQGVDQWLPIGVFLFLLYANRQVNKNQNDLKKKVDLYEDILGGYSENSPEENMNTLLSIIGKGFKFNHAHRVSVYKYDEGDNVFYRIGRFHQDSHYMFGGRTLYQRALGVIGKAWQGDNDNYYVEKLPDPDKSLDEYKQALMSNGIALPDTELNGIRFKARSFYCVRTQNPGNSRSNAIILFESKQPEGFRMKKIKTMLESEEGKVLAQMISVRKMPSENRERGL